LFESNFDFLAEEAVQNFFPLSYSGEHKKKMISVINQFANQTSNKIALLRKEVNTLAARIRFEELKNLQRTNSESLVLCSRINNFVLGNFKDNGGAKVPFKTLKEASKFLNGLINGITEQIDIASDLSKDNLEKFEKLKGVLSKVRANDFL